MKLKQMSNLINLRCFDYRKTGEYVNCMKDKLQARRISSLHRQHLDTNKPQNKTRECIWKSLELQVRTRQLLMNYNYYQFCNECMGSENELNLSKT